MNPSLNGAIESWEDEGGAASCPPGPSMISMSGTASQIEWAERGMRKATDEFDRVEASFRSIAVKQNGDQAGCGR
jgi:hypothetical protein